MVDSSRPAGLGQPTGTGFLSRTDASPSPAKSEVAGTVTNTSFTPKGPVSVPDSNANKFEKPTWLPIPGDGKSSIIGMAFSAGMRGLVGRFKENHPVLGRMVSIVDATIDAGKLMFGKGTPQERAKNWADFAAHTAGIFKPSIGASYDKAQANMRMTLAAGEAMNKVTGWFGLDLITPEMRQWYPVVAAGYGGYGVFNSVVSPGKEMPGFWARLAIGEGSAFALPKLANLFDGAKDKLLTQGVN